jgi:hypothetical protein
MNTIQKRLGGLVVLLALMTAGAAQAQVVTAPADNPYTGYGGRVAEGYNPYTGSRGVGQNSYNPYTGTRAQSRSYYNPYTGASANVQRAYNPYTGRYGYRYSYRR